MVSENIRKLAREELLRDDPFKPVTPLTNGAIDETLQQFAALSDDCLL